MNSTLEGAGRGRGWQRLPSILENFYVVPTHASSAKDTSVTAHCHAAPAQLTREYQGDHRRYVLTPVATRVVHSRITPAYTLDNIFHIRGSADKPGLGQVAVGRTSCLRLARSAATEILKRLHRFSAALLACGLARSRPIVGWLSAARFSR